MHVFHDIKLEIIQWTGLPRDALHVYVGLLIFLGAAALLKRPLAGRAPILAVLLAALAGETWDVLETWRGGEAIHWWRNWHDIWNTLFWPTALFLLARYTRVLKRA